MPSQEPLSRSGITSVTGVPNDAFTFWLRRGLVRPIDAPSGPGRHLRFQWYEANIAAVMNQLRQFGLPIDALLSIAATYRGAIAWAERVGLADRNEVQALWTTYKLHDDQRRGGYSLDDLAGDLDYFSDEQRLGAKRITPKIRSVHASTSRADFDQPYMSITEQPEPRVRGFGERSDLTHFWRVDDEWRFVVGGNGPYDALLDRVFSTIAVDVRTVIYFVWNRE